jgi:hypothetical protein
LIIRLEAQAELVVTHPQVSVGPARHSSRRDHLHLLRNDADIRRRASVVGEPIEAEAVVETTEVADIVLQVDIRPSSTTTTAATAAAAPETTS